MTETIRTNSRNNDFSKLVKLLDFDLAERDGDEHSFFAQFNKIDEIKHVVVVYENKLPVACGAIKEYDKNAMEIKRMFTLPEYRGKGLASVILSELEKWASELQYKRCILETGIKQPEAIRLYKKNSYKLISNYGQYQNVENSKCFEKLLK
ncbi:GNAT family N-acetyltransferase [Aquimarina aquimarini]|uniref:GNAT family N-acetyltransferase n=1 Tax=Aquimarina aquimarini TaxID=1191734 RepID=UPI000D56021B|nr:GNAT family N-acetyltransferase [Aquimarina aquimarini]